MRKYMKPALLKLLFLIEWFTFVLILVFQGKIQTFPRLWVALYPLLFFYFMGSLFFAMKDKPWIPKKTFQLIGLALGLVVMDQIFKWIVSVTLPVNDSFPIISGWLEITYRRNFHGAWIFTQLLADSIPLITPLLKFFCIALVLMIIPTYRYFKTIRGNKFWMNLSYVLLFAGILSWMTDMFMRGFILDYIGLPGIVAFDLKDIYVYLGAVALILEIVDGQSKFILWNGWNSEKEDIKKFTIGVWQIITQDLLLLYLFVKKFLLKKAP